MFLVVVITILIAALGGYWFLQRDKPHAADSSMMFKPKPTAFQQALAAGTLNEPILDAEEVSSSDDELNEGAIGLPDTVGDGKQQLSRLQKKKLEKQLEKEQRKAAQQAMLEERKKLAEASSQKEIDDAALEKLRLEKEELALAELREEKKRKNDEEYKLWTAHIGVESKGELGSADDHEKKLREFLTVESKLATKALLLDDTAKRFDVTVERLVAMIEAMVFRDEISGVFDDRGKFVFVTQRQYEEIAKFMRNRGRVSMTELIREANKVLTASSANADGVTVGKGS